MKKLILLLILSIFSISYVSAQYVDDLYVTQSDREVAKKRSEAQQQQRKAASQQRQREYQQTQLTYQQNQQEYAKGRYDEYVDNVQSAYLRRQDALTSSSTNSQAYWDAMDRYYIYLESKYDRDLYNIVVINDKIWVEPKYITAIFDGGDPTDGVDAFTNRMAKSYIENKRFSSYGNADYSNSNISFNINISPFWGGSSYYGYNRWGWNSGWNNPHYWGGYNSFWGGYNPYYGGYNPYWGGGYYPHWGWHRPIIIVPVNRHPVYHGNSTHRPYYNGGYGSNTGYGSPAPSQRPSVRPGRENYVPGMGTGTGGGNYRPNARPNNNTTRPSYKPNTDDKYDYRNNRPSTPTRQEPTYRPSTPAARPITPPTQTLPGGGRRR